LAISPSEANLSKPAVAKLLHCLPPSIPAGLPSLPICGCLSLLLLMPVVVCSFYTPRVPHLLLPVLLLNSTVDPFPFNCCPESQGVHFFSPTETPHFAPQLRTRSRPRVLSYRPKLPYPFFFVSANFGPSPLVYLEPPIVNPPSKPQGGTPLPLLSPPCPK